MSIRYFAPGVPGGEVSPGAGTTGFTSRAVAFANAAGQLTVNSSFRFDSTAGTLLVPGVSAGASLLHGTTDGSSATLGFYGAAGSTQPTSYTTVAATTARTFATTATGTTGNVSTFAGVTGSGCAFNTRAAMEAFLADFNALARVVQTMFLDLKGQGLLR